MSEQEPFEGRGERVGFPRMGDVIMSDAFVNGHRYVRSDDGTMLGPVHVSDLKTAVDRVPEDQRPNAWDETRAMAEFIVEEAGESTRDVISWKETVRGGGYGDPFEWEEERREHGHRVLARRLRQDGTYDPDGETITYVVYSGWDARQEIERYGRSGTIIKTPVYKTRVMKKAVSFT